MKQPVRDPETPEPICCVCQRGPNALKSRESLEALGDEWQICSTCRKLPVDQCNKIIADRQEAEYQATTGKFLDDLNEQKERDEREALKQIALPILAAETPHLALGDGTNASTVTTTALVPIGGGQALAVITQSSGLADERRRRRDAMETASRSADEVRARIQPRINAIDSEMEALPGEIKHSHFDGPFGARVEKFMKVMTPENYARYCTLENEQTRLQEEIDAAHGDFVKAFDDYYRWREMEQELRTEKLLEQASFKGSLKRYCARCGVQIPFWVFHASDYCKLCQGQPTSDLVWVEQQCSTCNSYFIGDGEGGPGEIPRNVDETTYCSYQCLLASRADLDEWPAADAACWSTVVVVPHPPLTSAAQAALRRRQILEDARRRFTTGASSPTLQPALTTSNDDRYINFVLTQGSATDAEVAQGLGWATSTVKDARHRVARRLGDRLTSDGGRPARWSIAPRALDTL